MPNELAIGHVYRAVGALDALMELAKTLPSPIPAQDAVPLLERVRGLARYVCRDALDDERAEMLAALLHPDFLSDKEYTPAVARASLGVLTGYLHGCITEVQVEAQRQANAAAYADAKIKEEKGVGFRPSGG